MKHNHLPALALAIILLWTLAKTPSSTWAQQLEKVQVTIAGEPKVDGARISVLVSVAEPGGIIAGLDEDAFSVTVAGQPVTGLNVEPVSAGMAAVVVVDRGGIADKNGCSGPSGSTRISEAKEIARIFTEQLTISESGLPDDMIALIGIGDENIGGATDFWPNQDFTHNPVDRNLVLNELEFLDAPERLLDRGTTTPLYEGLDRALDWLTENNDVALREALAERHKIILVLSDGIDREYSDDAVELGIIDGARKNNINIYSIGMACDSGSRLVPDSLRHISNQSGGQYWPHDSSSNHQQVLTRLPGLSTYRDQYLVTFDNQRSEGEYTLRVRVEAPQGADEDNSPFFSPLKIPQLEIDYPPVGLTLTEAVAISTTLPITAVVTFPDNVQRDMAVSFLFDGTRVSTTTSSPYRFDLDLANTAPGLHTIKIEGSDPLLVDNPPLVDEHTLEIIAATPVPTPTTRSAIPPPIATEDTGTFGNLLLWLVIPLIIAVIFLLVLLLRTRRQVGAVISSGVRQVTTRLTRALPSINRPTLAKLVVIRGPSINREYPLREQVTRFGREQDLCDEILNDTYVSGLQFSITHDANTKAFWIMDHESRNQTFLNGQQLVPNQYMQLQYGYIIRVGETELVFQKVGGTTHVLGP